MTFMNWAGIIGLASYLLLHLVVFIQAWQLGRWIGKLTSSANL